MMKPTMKTPEWRIVAAIAALLAATAPAAAQDVYGAIAIGQWADTGRAAMASISDGKSRADAERRAVLTCSLDLVGCRPVTWWKNACGSASFDSRRGRDGGGWGTGWAPTRLEARARAVASCRSAGNSNCRPGTAACTRNAPEYRQK
jgi:hypothetical protein